MLARTAERLADLAAEVPSAKAYVCDVSDQTQVDAALDLVEREMGAPSVLIHNAVGGAWGTFMEVDPATLNRNFQVNTMGLLYLARRLAPTMVTAGQGAIIVTGNTSAQRGRANFAGFAPTKAAQRILAEAMARDLGPKGVHVAYIVIDAVIDVPVGSRALQNQARRLFHRTHSNCRRSMACCKPAPLGMVVQRRGQTIRRDLVAQHAGVLKRQYFPWPVNLAPVVSLHEAQQRICL
jgi:NAD(P)-dependent dehydrogenase (short-subunit alcohol dehydrogenase family)